MCTVFNTTADCVSLTHGNSSVDNLFTDVLHCFLYVLYAVAVSTSETVQYLYAAEHFREPLTAAM